VGRLRGILNWRLPDEYSRATSGKRGKGVCKRIIINIFMDISQMDVNTWSWIIIGKMVDSVDEVLNEVKSYCSERTGEGGPRRTEDGGNVTRTNEALGRGLYLT
jgi:hypothetical protein